MKALLEQDLLLLDHRWARGWVGVPGSPDYIFTDLGDVKKTDKEGAVGARAWHW